jgi:hypothetical protein
MRQVLGFVGVVAVAIGIGACGGSQPVSPVEPPVRAESQLQRACVRAYGTIMRDLLLSSASSDAERLHARTVLDQIAARDQSVHRVCVPPQTH